MFGMIEGLSMVISRMRDEKDFLSLCNDLPKGQARKLRREREKAQKEALLHSRAIEIAEAGRARNFWGQ